MILELTSWIYFIFAFINFILVVIWNIINLFHEIRDYRFLKQHESPEYYFRYYYNKYIEHIEIPTKEDIQLLRNYLTELKEQQDLHKHTL